MGSNKADQSTSSLNDREKAFIHRFADLLSPWGLPPSAGRVFGYLLLKQIPASVDQIAADLELSRVGAWNAAKNLEAFGHVRRFSQPGSKQLLFAPADDFGLPFREQSRLVSSLAALLDECASHVAADAAVPALQQRAGFYRELGTRVMETLETLRAPRD